MGTRTKNTILIIFTSGIRQLMTVLLTFVSRTVFIKILGAEYLGLNGLFSNILSLLALTELGLGAAITFYLYEPLAKNDQDRINQIMAFYKMSYRLVGMIILIIGIGIMPFLRYIVNFEQSVPVNLYLVYFLYLINNVVSYLFFAYKQALLMANQEQYKIEKINIIFVVLNCICDIGILVIFRNYILYLVGKICLLIIKNIIISMKIDVEYPYIRKSIQNKLTWVEKKNILKDVKNVAIFKFGNVLLGATDNIIISSLLGTIVVGYYSNYYLIYSQVAVILTLISRSFTAGIGNLIATEKKEKQFEIFSQIDSCVYILTSVCTICLFQLTNSFIKIWIGGFSENYIFSQSIVAVLCANFYMDNTTQILNTFREGSGNFEIGKYYQFIAGIVNIVLSLALGKYFGLIGIFVATIIAKLMITVIPFIAMIGQKVFQVGKWYLVRKYFFRAAVTAGICGITWLCTSGLHMKNMHYFILEGIITIILICILLFFVYRNDSDFTLLKTRLYTINEGNKQ